MGTLVLITILTFAAVILFTGIIATYGIFYWASKKKHERNITKARAQVWDQQVIRELEKMENKK